MRAPRRGNRSGVTLSVSMRWVIGGRVSLRSLVMVICVSWICSKPTAAQDERHHRCGNYFRLRLTRTGLLEGRACLLPVDRLIRVVTDAAARVGAAGRQRSARRLHRNSGFNRRWWIHRFPDVRREVKGRHSPRPFVRRLRVRPSSDVGASAGAAKCLLRLRFQRTHDTYSGTDPAASRQNTPGTKEPAYG